MSTLSNDYFKKTQLKDRGWTESLIHCLLGEHLTKLLKIAPTVAQPCSNTTKRNEYSRLSRHKHI